MNDPTIFTWSFVLGFAAFVAVCWAGVQFIQAWDRTARRLDDVLDEPRICALSICSEPGVVLVGPTLWFCAHHGPIVREWLGGNMVYDQELDSDTDLGQWDRETGL